MQSKRKRIHQLVEICPINAAQCRVPKSPPIDSRLVYMRITQSYERSLSATSETFHLPFIHAPPYPQSFPFFPHHFELPNRPTPLILGHAHIRINSRRKPREPQTTHRDRLRARLPRQHAPRNTASGHAIPDIVFRT